MKHQCKSGVIRGMSAAVAAAALLGSVGCANQNLSEADQAALSQTAQQLAIRQFANLVTDTTFFVLDNAFVRLGY